MSDRLSTYWIYQRPVNDMLQLQTNLNKTQEQISSGKRILTPADDPVGASRVLQLNQEIALMDQYERNITLLDARLEQEEGVLSAVEDSVARIRELAVQAGNAGVLTEEDRIAIAAEVRERVDEMVDLMNTKDGSGEFLFSGFSGNTQPFVKNPGGGYGYAGDEGVRFLQVSQTITLASSDSGKDVFMDIPADEISFTSYANTENTGNPPGVISAGITIDQQALDAFYPEDAVITFENPLDIDPPEQNFTVRRKSDGRVLGGLENVRFTPGAPIQVGGVAVNISGNPDPGDQFVIESSRNQGVLTTFEKFLFTLENYPPGEGFDEVYDANIEQTLNNLDNTIANVSQVRARIGARLNTSESVVNQHADNKLAAKDIKSSIEDLDFAEAVSRLQMESFILQAAQQSFAQTSRLSLFDFI
ncbi:flagellar hook-associated protein FlgL [Saccharospirillum alexandrii]|uniref:flagellar hook-associated protein FlgL n=1 Tax=Saccharospirillum alexandrii TaxID=2448477 RepID=UPI00373576BD